MEVPEINGKPAVRIKVGLGEKIGLPKFSNVDIGPISIERYVEDDDEVIVEELKQSLVMVEELMADEREKVSEWLKSQQFN